jgi:hypothetical protein
MVLRFFPSCISQWHPLSDLPRFDCSQVSIPEKIKKVRDCLSIGVEGVSGVAALLAENKKILDQREPNIWVRGVSLHDGLDDIHSALPIP